MGRQHAHVDNCLLGWSGEYMHDTQYHHNMRKSRLVCTGYSGGFSIVELLITLTVFFILATALIVSYRSYDLKFAFETEAHMVAQHIREAQISAMSMRQTKTGSFTAGYGVHFKPDTGEFTMFADLNDNGRINNGEEEEVVTLKHGVRISSLCGEVGTASTLDCSLPLKVLQSPFDSLDIVFRRPNPDAMITNGMDSAPPPPLIQQSHVRIVLQSPKGYTRHIDVWETGQISVQ